MKKILIIVMIVLMVFGVATASVFASGVGNGNSAANAADRICPVMNECVSTGQCVKNYADENNDGICDNYADGNCAVNKAGHHTGGYGHGNGCRR